MFSWVSRLFRRPSPLGLAVDDERKVCANVVEFELLLKDRKKCPTERARQFHRRPWVQLHGSLKECQRLLDKVELGLQGFRERSREINELLMSLQLPRGARDHGWAYMLRTLSGLGPAYDLYKVAALTKLRLYLKSVKAALMDAVVDAAGFVPDNRPFIASTSKELAAITSVPAFVTRVPPQCVA